MIGTTMKKTYYSMKLTLDEIKNSKDKIFCIWETNGVICRSVYYIKENNKLNSLINDNSYDISHIENVKVYEVTEDNKLNYIKDYSNDEIDTKNIDDIFIKLYKANES